jgi:hypothetical protein
MLTQAALRIPVERHIPVTDESTWLCDFQTAQFLFAALALLEYVTISHFMARRRRTLTRSSNLSCTSVSSNLMVSSVTYRRSEFKLSCRQIIVKGTCAWMIMHYTQMHVSSLSTADIEVKPPHLYLSTFMKPCAPCDRASLQPPPTVPPTQPIL